MGQQLTDAEKGQNKFSVENILNIWKIEGKFKGDKKEGLWGTRDDYKKIEEDKDKLED